MNPHNTSRKIPLVLAIAVVTGNVLWQLRNLAGLERWADARERQILPDKHVIAESPRHTPNCCRR